MFYFMDYAFYVLSKIHYQTKVKTFSPKMFCFGSFIVLHFQCRSVIY